MMITKCLKIKIFFYFLDEPEIPFDKQHLQSQIEAGGGTIFDSWSDKVNKFLCYQKP